MDASQTIPPTGSGVEPVPGSGAVNPYRKTQVVTKLGDTKPVQTPALPTMWGDEADNPWRAAALYAAAFVASLLASHYWPWGVA